MGTQGGAVDTVGHVLLPIASHVAEPKALWLRKIKLHRAHRLFATGHGNELNVHLGAIEGGLTYANLVVEAHFIEDFLQQPLRVGPSLGVRDLLVRALGIVRIHVREAH